jgi:3-isopropylmalate/(R)-2-methylmalate dehydratase small subunit
MEKFTTLEGIAAPLAAANVDTDTIIRIERCARTPKNEMGPWAFEPLRYLPDGAENPDFVLNQPRYRGASILVCGENFGCGSSREMAVWALAGMGVRCVIAPSFGEIFFNNCFQNGLLAVRLAGEAVARLQAFVEATPRLTVDLERQQVHAGSEPIAFEIEPLRKRALIEGLDPIGVTLLREAGIAAWQARDRSRRPWVYAASDSPR